MKQNLGDWVATLASEGFVLRALEDLAKHDFISGIALGAARRAPDFGRGQLYSSVMEMERTEVGQKRLDKLKALVRQWRAVKKQKSKKFVTRKVVLSPEANKVLEDMVGDSGTDFDNSGLVDFLLKEASASFRGEKRILEKERAELKVEAANKAAELEKAKFRLTQRKERLDAREEEIEMWRKLKAFARKAAKTMAIDSEQEITIRLTTLKDGNRHLDLKVNSGSQKLKQKVFDSTSDFLTELSSLIEK